MRAQYIDYYTTWSCAWFALCVVVYAILILMASSNKVESKWFDAMIDAAVLNMLTVQSVGPLVLAFGRLPSDLKTQLVCNALMHSLPGTAAVVLAARRKIRSDVRLILMNLALFQLAYLVTPTASGQGSLDKVANSYGLQRPLLWCCGVLSTQMLYIYIFHRQARCP